SYCNYHFFNNALNTVLYTTSLHDALPILVTGTHIFFEFVPFTHENFDADGNLLPHARVVMLDKVEEGKEYAILLSTTAGAWRYLDRKSTRLNSSHVKISYDVFCLKKKKT